MRRFTISTKLSLIILALIIICSCIVGATNDANEDTFVDSSSVTLVSYDTSGTNNAAVNYVTSIYFNHIENFNRIGMLKYYGKYASPWYITPKHPDNNTYEYIKYYDAITNTYLGSGLRGYSIDYSNNIYIYYTFSNWSIVGLTGAREVNISYSRSGYPECFNPDYHACSGALTYTYGLYSTSATSSVFLNVGDPNYARADQVFLWIEGAITGRAFIPQRQIDYDKYAYAKYERVLDSPYDYFNFTRVDNDNRHYETVIDLSHIVNGSFISVFNNTGSNNSVYNWVKNGTIQSLTIRNPQTNFTRTYNWYPNLIEDVNINRFTGDSASSYLDEGESTTITFNTNNDPNVLGKVVWEYTANGNKDNPNVKSYFRNGSWWYEGGTTGTALSWDEVRTLNTNFLCSDYNTSAGCNLGTTWGSRGKNNVKVTLFDYEFYHNTMDSQGVYVGGLESVPIVYLNVRDTVGSLLNLAGTFHVYDNTTSTDFTYTPSPVASSELNYGHVYSFWFEPLNYTVAYYGISNDGINTLSTQYLMYHITVSWSNYKYITAFISKAGVGNNTITFYVTDEEYKALSDVKITNNEGDIEYTNAYGVADFELPENLYYDFIFDKTGYEQLTYRELLDSDKTARITMSLLTSPITPTPTTTTTSNVTVTPTGVPTSETGLPIVDLAGLIIDLFKNFGLDAGQAKLFAGMFFIFCGAVIGASLVPHPMIILTGGYAGFILAILSGVWPAYIFVAVSAMAALAIAYMLFGRDK